MTEKMTPTQRETAARELVEMRALHECARRLTLEQRWSWILRGAGAVTDAQLDAVFAENPALAIARPQIEKLRAYNGRGPWVDRPILESPA